MVEYVGLRYNLRKLWGLRVRWVFRAGFLGRVLDLGEGGLEIWR